MNKIFDDLFIFEMANNHQGSVHHGVKIVGAMAEISRKHNINSGVKLQYRDLDTFIHPDYLDREDVKHIPRFLSTRLTDEEFATLVDAIQDQGMLSIVTPFDEPSVGKCVDHGVNIIKVASCSAKDWPLLETIADTRKPIIVSTAGLSIYDIDKVASFLSHLHIDFALMHCVALYPVLLSVNMRMNRLSKMAKRYPYVPVGYSGHEAPDNLDVVKVAVSKDAKILERHVGVPTDTIKLNAYSMTPEQAETWVESALLARDICGQDEEKQVSNAEIDSLNSLMRGVFASKNIEIGQVIEREDVFFAMPNVEGQTTSGEFGRQRTTLIASIGYKPGEPIFEQRKSDTINLIRGIIHDAKGMIYEAGIALNGDMDIELSHHYGIEDFRQTGAVIISVLNREYCKKLIIVLPGQNHPTHRHEIKEETFQLLWGDLAIWLDDDDIIELGPGDTVLVERGSWHSFVSINGAVIEEISTTHVVGDSEYVDESIAQLDILERKTVVEDWWG